VELSRRSTGPRLSGSSLILALYGGVAGVGLLIGALRGQPNVYVHTARELLTWQLAIGPLVGVVVGLAVVFATRLAVHQFEWARQLHRSFRGLLGNLHARDMIILAAASSIGEEILFRGALLPWIGLWPSTLVFALLHIGPGWRYLSWTASAFLAGLMFSGLFIWTGDLGAPIAAHFVINYLNLGYIVRVRLPE
jgi:membrane protease YdiL (CAAX protease family)